MTKRKKNIDTQSDDEDNHQGNNVKKAKRSHKARQASPAPQVKRPHSPSASVSEKTNPSTEKPMKNLIHLQEMSGDNEGKRVDFREMKRAQKKTKLDVRVAQLPRRQGMSSVSKNINLMV